MSKYFDPQPQPTDQTSCPRCEQALHLKSERYFFTKLHTFPLILILPMSQDLFCCIKGDIGAARLTICRTSGSCLQINSSRRKLFGVAMTAQSVTTWRLYILDVYSHSRLRANKLSRVNRLPAEREITQRRLMTEPLSYSVLHHCLFALREGKFIVF